MQHEIMEYDVVIVGAGPAGLSAAIRLKQLCQARKKELSVCVVEKGASVGAHILSGAVLEPTALNELFPQWQKMGAPLQTSVTHDSFFMLTENNYIPLPTPIPMRNRGNHIISLGNFCRWLALQAEQLGVDVFPGFSASEVLYDAQNRVLGVATTDMGRDKNGRPTERFQPGVHLHAKQTLFAEGCRGHLTQTLLTQFNLMQGTESQTYGMGIKELWEVPEEVHQPGLVMHTVGWPLPSDTYGGSFIYHLEPRQIAVGFVIGLDYQNPYLSPFEEFQRFKTHPMIRPLFENGKRITYGARALAEGGFQSIPNLSFPGGLLIGDAAGFLNVPKIKGIHTAMKSGMVAASVVFYNHFEGKSVDFKQMLQRTWLWDELYRVRNIRPAFAHGLWAGLAYAAVDTYVFRGKAPWTLKHREPDHLCLKKAALAENISYPKPDGIVSFDRLSSVYLTNVNHEENQPCHLELKDAAAPITINLALYDAPEQRYCPAGVYEIVQSENGQSRLQINAQNCIHCKTCDIKDPTQNIHWAAPEGGGGPNYVGM